MNLIAVDIGNTNIKVGLFLKGEEKGVESVPGQDEQKLTGVLKAAWEQIPLVKNSKEKKHDGVIVVSSVNPIWTALVAIRNSYLLLLDILGLIIYIP